MTHQPASNQKQRTLADLMIQPRERALLVGQTGTGKSTFAGQAIATWTRQPSRTLIIDSKPHFRADELLSGVPARWHYRHWSHGDAVPGSYLLPLKDVPGELKQVWRLGGRVAIAQVDRREQWPLLEWAIDSFFTQSRAKHKQYLYIDELADFYGTSATFRRGDPILRVVRSGRERGIAVMAATQRPRHIPPAVLTEMTRLYAFRLKFREDRKRLQEMGLPEDVRWPPLSDKHAFLYYHAENEETGVYKLKLEREGT